MKIWLTELRALEVSSGTMKLYCGDNVEAPTHDLAQQWCGTYQPYLKVIGELVAEIPCKPGTHEADFSKQVDYDNIQNN